MHKTKRGADWVQFSLRLRPMMHGALMRAARRRDISAVRLVRQVLTRELAAERQAKRQQKEAAA